MALQRFQNSLGSWSAMAWWSLFQAVCLGAFLARRISHLYAARTLNLSSLVGPFHSEFWNPQSLYLDWFVTQLRQLWRPPIFFYPMGSLRKRFGRIFHTWNYLIIFHLQILSTRWILTAASTFAHKHMSLILSLQKKRFKCRRILNLLGFRNFIPMFSGPK